MGNGGDDTDFFTMDDFSLGGKTVLVRVDINSPIDPGTGRILNDNRIRQHMVTLRDLRDSKVAILAHQGRPGKDDFVTMEAHAERLSYHLGREIRYVDSLFGKSAVEAIRATRPGDYILLENTRFYSEEVLLRDVDASEMASGHLVRTLAPLSDFFINDAFAAAHRAQPSLVGFSEVLPCLAGRVLEKEVSVLQSAFEGKARPRIAVLGGVKVEDTVAVARQMLARDGVDRILTTGAVANFFLWAGGRKLGKGYEEFLRKGVPDFDTVFSEAKGMLKKYPEHILVPVDVVTNVKGQRRAVAVDDLPVDYPIHDIGLDTIVQYLGEISDAKVIFLNGPVGVFEIEEFAVGTSEIFLGVARSQAFKIAGGGHTVTAIEQLGISQQMDHISTGGGSLMYFLAGRPLPVLDALRRSKARFKEASSEDKVR